jgi:putative two-component system response regulator
VIRRRPEARVLLAAAFIAVCAAGLAWASGSLDGLDRRSVITLAALALGTAIMVIASHLVERRERRRVAHDRKILEERVRERTEELRETQLEIIHRLGAAVESCDAETGVHIARINLLCRRLSVAIGLTREEAELIGHASAMHDVGKIGIPGDVLLKPAKLDPREWELMQTHTTAGAGILGGSSSPLMRLAESIALTHHERWDGSGYPFGLKREQIPLEGRICAICDVFDALVSKRPYKDAMSVPEAIAEIRRERGRHFDPELVDAFLALGDHVLKPPPTPKPADDITILPRDIRISTPSR